MVQLTSIVSDALSVITISMCLFLKVPQIRSILQVKNARGINIYGPLMELGSYSTTALYNYVNGYAILTYLEYPIIIAQEYVLIYLVLFYQNLLGKKAIISIILYFGLVIGLAFKIIPDQILMFLMPLTTPVSLSSKGVQLWEIIKSQNADSVSISTWVISAVTNASRIYTIYMDSADLMLLTNFCLSTLMSASIALAAYTLQTSNAEILRKAV